MPGGWRGFFEWMCAWFGGCASTAFSHGDPVFAWTAVVIALGCLAAVIWWPKERRSHDRS